MDNNVNYEISKELIERDNKGRFIKGHRPLMAEHGKCGRFAIAEETKESLAALCPTAIERLKELLVKPNIKDRDLIEVIKIVIERNLGKVLPNVDIEMQTQSEGEFQVNIKVID